MKATGFYRRDNCRLCGSYDLLEVLNLIPTPPANAFVDKSALERDQPTFPLDVYFCESCAHVQLLDVVSPETLFSDYLYVSGTSPVFVQHFKEYAETIVREFVPEPVGSLAVDIGSNDGTLLKQFQMYGMEVIGVDPAEDIARLATAGGVPTLPKFFTSSVARDLQEERGVAQVICANNVFAHADNLTDIIRGIRILLASEGVFVFEVSYLLAVFEDTLFDTIYHEHLAYHSVKPLKEFFSSNGMELIAVQRVPSHGGSLRGIVQKIGSHREVRSSVQDLVKAEARVGLHNAETLRQFGSRIDAVGAELKTLITSLKHKGKVIAGFGAPAKATTLMYQFDIGADLIDFIVDDSPLKQNLFSPGMHIPVLPTSAIYTKNPDVVIILAWNFAESIIKNNALYLEQGGQFIVPLPKVEVFE